MSSPFEVTATTIKEGEYKLAPAGAQPAVCIGVIDLGIKGAEYDNGKTEWVRRVYLMFELTEDEERNVIGKEFTLKFSDKAKLREFVTMWRGGVDFPDKEKFSVDKLKGQPCVLNIKHTKANKKDRSGKPVTRTYANIEGVSKPMKGVVVPPPEREPFVWFIGGDSDLMDQDWFPRLYGEKLVDVIAEGKRNLLKKERGEKPPSSKDSASDFAGSSEGEGIPEGDVPF